MESRASIGEFCSITFSDSLVEQFLGVLACEGNREECSTFLFRENKGNNLLLEAGSACKEPAVIATANNNGVTSVARKVSTSGACGNARRSSAIQFA